MQLQKNKFLLNGLLALSIAGLYYFLSESQWAKGIAETKYDRRTIAKDFNLPVIGIEPGDAGQVTLASLKGTPSVISFWASWCNVCRGETPQLMTIANELQALGLKPIVAIASYDNAIDVRESERYRGGRFRFLLDKEGTVALLWKVRGLPQTFVLDQDGAVVLSYGGALTEIQLAEIQGTLRFLTTKTAH